MIRKKIAILLAAAVMMLPVLTSCSSAKTAAPSENKTAEQPAAAAEPAPADKILRIASSDNPATLDPQKTSEYYREPLNIYDRLVEAVTVDGKPELVPGLAESWDVSEDGLVYTFHLAKNVKFHNGEPFTADDVVFTIDRMMNPNTAAMNTDFFDMIKGATEVFEGKAEHVEGVKAVDDNTLEITLEEPFAPFLANIATPGCSILNREATEAAGDQFGIDVSVTVGTGPFKVEKWSVNQEVVLSANKDYFKGAPQIDGYTVKIIPDAETQRMMFESGELDVFNTSEARTQIPYFKSNPDYQDNIVSAPEAGLYFYAFNNSIEPYNNVKVRQALQMAIDRQTILESMYDGEGKVLNTFLPESVLGHKADAKTIEYNPEKAKELLAEAGYPNGFDMEIIQVSGSATTLEMNEVVQSMLSQIGVNAKITQVDEATYYAMRKAGEIPVYRSSWWADYNDPDNFYYTFFSEKNAVVRSTCYNNPEVFAGLDEARTMVDPDARLKYYQDMDEMIIQEDAAILPMFQMNKIFIVSDRVKEFHIAWNGWSDMSFYDVVIEN
ncbi:MAG: ABC transporter substrate-binding protein [Sedimentibacter sp.]|uniref:ABC transporter substrate-binding protein n=1 Tax=Sedimentibacter sp. TaxID=1960295 RepID=UPI0031596845